MKKIIFLLAIVLVVLSLARSHSFASNIQIKNPEAQSLGRPYIIEVVEVNGDISKEAKGVSSNSDPYLITQDLGMAPFPEDKFKSFPDIKMNIGSKITLYRAPVINIKDGKRSKEVRSWKKNIKDLFSEQKVEIGKDDKVNFSLDTAVENNMEIVITRVAITTVVEPEAIKFITVKKSNPNIEKGNNKTLQAGKNGTKNKYYLVRREDGDEVSRKLQKIEVAETPTDEIVEIGTKVVVYGTGKATWYVKTGDMIAAHNSLPKGTKVNVINVSNGKSVVVTIKGGGIYHDDNVIIDLSTAAFQALGAGLGTGKLGNVRIEKYYPEN